MGGEKKLSKSVSGYFMTKKKSSMTILSPRGGGRKALMARPSREELFYDVLRKLNFIILKYLHNENYM